MKNFLVLSFFLLCATQSAMAQFKAGMIPVGGSLNAESYHEEIKTDTASANIWSLGASPTLGYYYSDHSALGLSFTYSYRNFDVIRGDTITDYDHQYSYEIAPFWRYNQPVTGKFGLFGILSPGIEYLASGSRGQAKQSSWIYSATTQVGAYFFPVNKVSLEASLAPLGYSYTYNRGDTRTTDQKFDFNLRTTSYSISFYYYFGSGSVL